MVVRSFENPVTKTSYRLTVHGDLWRIIKSRTRGDQLVIRSLRGNTAEGPVEPSLLDRLVRGEKEIPIANGDGGQAFGAVVLIDLDRTHHTMIGLAQQAHDRYALGAPGFRPRSPVLKMDAYKAFEVTDDACQKMAQSWLSAGFDGEPLPWIGSALERKCTTRALFLK